MTDVLIISDNLKLSEILREGFNQCSKRFNIIWVKNGNKAIEVVRTFILDVIIMDADTLAKEAFELLPRLRQLQNPNHVIILSEDDGVWNDERLAVFHFTRYKTSQNINDIIARVISPYGMKKSLDGTFVKSNAA